jgi:hypothetical protein
MNSARVEHDRKGQVVESVSWGVDRPVQPQHFFSNLGYKK